MSGAARLPTALDGDQLALAEVARAWLADRSPTAVVRERLEAPPQDTALPVFWEELTALGWVGLAVPAEHGGQGAGPAEMCVVLEEWGRACAPGPLPATALVATVLGRCAPHLLGPILAGEAAAVLDPPESTAGTPVDGGIVVDGIVVDGGGEAAWFLVPGSVVSGTGDGRWSLVPSDRFEVEPVPSADPTRRLATVSGEVPPGTETFAVPDGLVTHLQALFCAAESVGVAAWCVDTAADWACTREQFDQPIGRFQAVKHRCADALCRLELARAATWDAAAVDPEDPEASMALAAAGALAPTAAFECAKDVIQVLGGIGYTWEHDAHLYLRRAALLRHRSRSASAWRDDLVGEVAAGSARTLRVELPAEAEQLRVRIKSEVAELAALPREEWNAALADGGWLQPHWPRPWGRDAAPVEQLVIDEELAAAGVRRRHLQVAAWVLPTIVAHGTDAQTERWVGPSLRGELNWCQLFSEPGAGSDLASLSTRAERVDGGWVLSGQKVWTTLAREADLGLCLARSHPGAPKHDGITCFVVDMAAAGVEVRPLRELTGFAMFNEVFLDGVFVAEDCVVGEPGDGWRCARTTLENERVSMASGSSFGPGVVALVDLARERNLLGDPRVSDLVGALLVDSQALAALGARTTLRALGARQGGPGPEASVRKLLVVEHEQAVQEAALSLLGPDAVIDRGEAQRWFGGFLGNRALSIAGGTSEIQRNVIAERLLGLPRD